MKPRHWLTTAALPSVQHHSNIPQTPPASCLVALPAERAACNSTEQGATGEHYRLNIQTCRSLPRLAAVTAAVYPTRPGKQITRWPQQSILLASCQDAGMLQRHAAQLLNCRSCMMQHAASPSGAVFSPHRLPREAATLLLAGRRGS